MNADAGRPLLQAAILGTVLSLSPSALGGQACPAPADPADGFRGGFGRQIGVHFGRSMDVDGPTLVVGSLGAAVVFEWRDDRWIQAQVLTPPDNLTSGFGFSVAVSGSRIVIGDPSYNRDEGGVWLFERSGRTWSVVGSPLQPGAGGFPPQRKSRFGFSIDLDGDRFVVGAPGYVDPATRRTGLAFLFERGSGGAWKDRQLQPRASDPDNASFGFSVAISGTRAAVGMPRAATRDGDAAGLVSLHEEGLQWRQTQGIQPTPAAEGDAFGTSVSLSGDLLAVGAPSQAQAQIAPGPRGPGTYPSGAAFVFDLGPGLGDVAQTARVRPDLYCNPYVLAFGTDVDLKGTTLLVGAPRSDLEAGTAFLYERIPSSIAGQPDWWAERASLVGDPPIRAGWTTLRFGTAVAVAPMFSTAAAGAPAADRQTGWLGVYERVP